MLDLGGCGVPVARELAAHGHDVLGDTSLASTLLVCLGPNGHHAQLHDRRRVLRTDDGRRIVPHGYLDEGPGG